MTDSFDKIFGDKRKVLVVSAHPDDAEIICGGIAARLVAEGKQVRLVVTTNGEKGSKTKKISDKAEFAKSRMNEAVRGAGKLGIPPNEVFNLGLPDGEIENTVENIGKIVFHIRQFKPDAIITHNPEDVIIKYSDTSYWVNHRDHLITGLITTYAAYPYSRDTNFFPEQLKKLQTHSVNDLLYADYYASPEVLAFDIGKYLNQRREALSQHETAFGNEEVEDYMSEVDKGDGYFEMLRHVKIY